MFRILGEAEFALPFCEETRQSGVYLVVGASFLREAIFHEGVIRIYRHPLTSSDPTIQALRKGLYVTRSLLLLLVLAVPSDS